jgi:glycolate oxidase FAD binding subunit
MLEKLRSITSAQAGASAERWRVHDITPACVVAPASADEAAAVLDLCSREGWLVECAGAGTWLGTTGRAPRRVDVLLTSERLSGIVEYEPADLTLGAAAGAHLTDLRLETLQHRQFLPFDPPGAGTLGATIATASAGPLRASVGSPRDNVLGLEVVTGDGRLLNLGGRVVKNVAGYDLVRLMVGSRGTLAFITRAHVRLRPLPECDETHVFPAVSMSELPELASALEPIAPAALEISALPGAGWILAARLRGNPDAVAYGRECVRQTATDFRVLDSTRAAQYWEELGAQEASAGVMIRLAALPAELHHSLASAARIAYSHEGDASGKAAAPGLPAGWAMAAHASEGIVRVWRTANNAWSERAAADLVAAVQRERVALREQGGSVHILSAGTLPNGTSAWSADETLLNMMRTLKSAFDPAGILAPGRFLP